MCAEPALLYPRFGDILLGISVDLRFARGKSYLKFAHVGQITI